MGPLKLARTAWCKINLAPNGITSPVAGSAIISEALVQYMLSGWTYVDIPTRKYPRGEIRGRLAVRPPGAAKVIVGRASAAIAAALLPLCAAIDPVSAASSATAPQKKFSFVVVGLSMAVYETEYMDECPEGLALSNDELWWLNTPPAVRAQMTNEGDKEPEKWLAFSNLRGPHGEDACWNPTLVNDPPLRTVQGRLSYGMNLDGTQDGHATPQSCPHRKFTGVDQRPGVDNQLYRVVGCTYGWRASGFIARGANTERRDSSQGVILVEISGVDDWHTDGDVKVAFYRAVDALPKDSVGNILPYASYRIDDPSRYGTITQGRMRNGVLTTDPVDAHLPFYGNLTYTEMHIRGLRLELHATPDGRGAEGLLAGYQDLDNWYDYIRKIEYLTTTGQFSCPAFYAAAKRLADGYPDPKTGDCTALSAAFRIEALPAFVIHPDARTAGPL